MPANKYQRWSSTMFRRGDTTEAVGEDVIDLVATFASCRDLCTLGRVCRRFGPVSVRESLWELRALDILPSRPQLHSAMAKLHLVSYRQLVEAFTRIGIPGGVLGFWSAEAPTRSWAAQLELSSRLLSSPSLERPTLEEREARGELLRISLSARGFLCESIAPDGTSRCIFIIRVSTTPDQQVKVGFFSMERDSSATMGSSSYVPGRSIGDAFLEHAAAVPGPAERTPIRASGNNAFFLDRDGGRTCRFTKLKAPFPLPPCRSAASRPRCPPSQPAEVAEGLCGLWCAPYGTHGLEIIQLSVDSSDATPTPTGLLGGRTSGIRTTAVKTGGRSTASVSSSGKTSSSESVCTSAPATDDCSEAGCGDLCSSVESDDSGAEDDGEQRNTSAVVDRRAMRANAAAASSRVVRNKGDTGRDAGYDAEEETTGEGGDIHRAIDDDPSPPLPPQLFGVKVTGDANVPAGKTSFAIDLGEDCDVDEEVEADRRPVVLFLPSGAVMASLTKRRDQISFWRKGRGQINRVPGRWSPEWVDVDFVAYQADSRCAFSVVFRQPEQAVRVIMDFERALGFKEEWPQWPLAAVSA